MEAEFVEHHERPPSAPAFMARAFLPRPKPRSADFPRLVERWRGVRIDRAHVEAFSEATGLGVGREVPVLYPHVFGFRLQMALLTHRAFPLPVWGALQIRARLVRHRRFGPGESLDLETRVGERRLVDKGVEVDLLSRLVEGSECVWESEVTYFYRGRFGAAQPPSPRASSPDLSAATVVDRFRMPRGGGWGFGALTGDYNGIHTWGWYARRFGFRAAFPHPQRVAGLCQARLPELHDEAQTLDLWIKGPVFYGAEVSLRALQDERGLQFGLALDDDSRAALVGRWRGGEGTR